MVVLTAIFLLKRYETEPSESLYHVFETLLCFYHTLREDLGGVNGELGQIISTLEINLAEILGEKTGAVDKI